MVDEALQASLKGRVRQAPDFSPLALQHLHTSCLALRELIKQYLSMPSRKQLDSVITALSDIHRTLQLLDRQGAVLVTKELLALLRAMAQDKVDDVDACAHTLVFAGEKLTDYVAHLRKPRAVDSALPMLPVINNCRACRGEQLLSEMLVVASGIQLPDSAGLDLPGEPDIASFCSRVKESRPPLMQGLLRWFRNDGELQESLDKLRTVFARLAEACDSPSSLKPLVPMFESAEFICLSVNKGGLDNSAAVHRLFAQMERTLDGYSKLAENNASAFAHLVPERLFLNLLYYVAISTHTTPKSVMLRRRFRLDRFSSRGMPTERAQVVFEGVGDRLTDSIREAIEIEITAARAWLVEPGSSSEEAKRVLARLQQLEPALLLFGAQVSLRQLQMINVAVAPLVSSTEFPQNKLDHVADSLVRLERALDSELCVSSDSSDKLNQTAHEAILAACLDEAQSRLLHVEKELLQLFPDDSNPVRKASLHEASAAPDMAATLTNLSMIDSALQVMPLPEVSPLIRGVQGFIARNENALLSRASRRDLATVMVSLGYYLNSVLQPNGAAGQLLLEAEDALEQLINIEPEDADGTIVDGDLGLTDLYDVTMPLDELLMAQESDYDETRVDSASGTAVDNLIDIALHQLSVVSENIGALSSGGDNARLAHTQINEAYQILAEEASDAQAPDLFVLSNANLRLLESPRFQSFMQDSNAQSLLDESLAVLPQLINQLQSRSDKVYGLQSLLDNIDELVGPVDNNVIGGAETTSAKLHGSDADDTAAFIANEANSTTEILDFTELEIDSTLSVVTDDLDASTASAIDNVFEDTNELPMMTLDNTLEQVFYRECEQHINTLREAVDNALNSRDWSSDSQKINLENVTRNSNVNAPEIDPAYALPTRDTLRALHTLTGSAQTVDAQGIIAIAQPLQRAVLFKQRSGDTFDRQQTEYIGELVGVINTRLEHLISSRANGSTDDQLSAKTSAADAAIHQQLAEFVARCEPWVPERKPGLQVNDSVSSLANVFNEEARELLDGLRSDTALMSDPEQRTEALNRIMSGLHTIKGSARMAGQLPLADRAHLLEDEIRDADNRELDTVLASGVGELQTLLLVTEPASNLHQKDHEQTEILASTISEEAIQELTNPHESVHSDLALEDSKRADSTIVDTPGNLLKAKPEPGRVHSESMGLTEASFENMLSLASRATVSQARLGESLLRLRDACTEIETTTARLKRLPHEHPSLSSPAVTEMLSDLVSAQRLLADAIMDAEADQAVGSRADASLHQALIRVQLVSFSEADVRLRHAVSDACTQTEKQAEFVLDGGEITVDKATFRKLLTPLEHLVRNAVVHGIEAPADRIASGKSEKGLVRVFIEIDGTDLLVSVEDNGTGVDQKAVNAQLAAKGHSEATSIDETLSVLSEPGFSTLDSADQLAGRGIGLATVNHVVKELNGSLQLGGQEHGGSTFSLRIPQSTRINQVVLVEQDGQAYAVPVNFIHSVLEERQASGTDIDFNGNEYRYCSLAQLFGQSESPTQSANSEQCLLMSAHQKHVALMVDNIVGYREIIAQPLGAQLVGLHRFLGGSVLADGTPVLIPDFNRLLQPGTESKRSANLYTDNTLQLQPAKHSALIVDDSITMRVAAEQLLLELNIEPSMARDGAEALELLRTELPDVLLVDIDMPNMDGFDFLRHLRALHPDHEVPVIMISTRSGDADRAQAADLGAAHFLTKPYKDQELQHALTRVGILR